MTTVMLPPGPAGQSDGAFDPDDFAAEFEAESDSASVQKRHTTAGRRFPAQILAAGEVDKLLAACSRTSTTGIRNRALIVLLYRSGLRISEALDLTVGDVDFETHSIRVLDGKGHKSTTRAFHPNADDALLRWIEHRRRLGVRGHVPLFCTFRAGRHGAMYPQYVRNLLPALAAKAGIDRRVHPHGLRHTFAVELERSGTRITVISKLLGHSSIAVTSRYLDHLTNDEAVKALAVVQLPALTEA